MFLTLEITAGPGFEQLPERQHTFGLEGGRIGRTAGNEWVIPHEFLHREHASVRFFSGLFYIEKRGQNLVAVNGSDRDLASGDSYPLRDGDKLFLDEFEIAVRITAQAPAPRPVIAPPPTPPQPAVDSTGIHRSLGSSGFMGLGDEDGEDELDNFLKNRNPAPVVQRARADEVNRSAAIHDRIDLPMNSPRMPPQPPAPPGGGGLLQEGWDKTSFNFNPPAAPQAMPASPPPSPPPQRYAEPPRPAPPRQPPAPSPAAYQPAAPQRAPQPAAASGDLAALLAHAGIDPRLLAPGEAELLGRALRESLAGIIRVLQVRSEMRSRFRLSGTRTAAVDRNPLKAAANIDDALHEFFRHRARDALPLDQAVGHALEEIDWHQTASLDAMQVAFFAMLERFDPASIEEEADRTGRRSGLTGRAGRLWEAYETRFKAVAADRDEAFRKIFGAEFARAYDEALERRRTAARNKRPL